MGCWDMNVVKRIFQRGRRLISRIATLLKTPVEQWTLGGAGQKWLSSRNQEIVIGTKTTVRGDMNADHITVKGRVNGRVTGSLITITQMGTLKGRVYAESFEVDERATLDAQCSVREKEGGMITQKHNSRTQNR